ncbi:MAG: tRNA (adenosine(37)-N6)-threonylcarbamoyltransferase complex ATPase subunit type 1 TsaE [Gammaproteobacteria bacterium]|nr:tRNA (adenosine(37)-N6)-threonylcarbamoyltransferase complex ATPase subunit type 1 TsaE [Gammaproteobacteria bacterium]
MKALPLATEDALIECARDFAASLTAPAVVFLSGELGAGKSVFARAVIHSLGFRGGVKSPTYTLVETYTTSQWRIAHLDLYRLVSSEELHYIGFEDIVANHDLLLIEWPERGEDALPEPTHQLLIEYADTGRKISGL